MNEEINIKTSKAWWVANWLWWFGVIIVIIMLLISPIFSLISDILNTISEINDSSNITWNEEDSWLAKQILWSIMAIFIILLVVFTPSDKIHSPLYYSWVHTIKWINDLTDWDSYKNEPDKLKSIIFEIIVFWLASIWIFWMYLYLINSVTSFIWDNTSISIIWLIWLLFNILVIALLNSGLVSILSKHEPAPIYSWGVFEIDINNNNIKKEVGSKLLWWILLLVANIIILSIWLMVKNTIEKAISDSNIVNIIEWEVETIDDILPNFR